MDYTAIVRYTCTCFSLVGRWNWSQLASVGKELIAHTVVVLVVLAAMLLLNILMSANHTLCLQNVLHLVCSPRTYKRANM